MKDNDYSMLKFYKGEKQNPYKAKLKSVEVDLSHLSPPESMKYEYTIPRDEAQKLANSMMFWFYESFFANMWEEYESSDWYHFFFEQGKSYADDFLKTLSEEDHERPTNKKKKQIFEIWKRYLFSEKLYREYGGHNWLKEQYDTITPPTL